MAAIRRRQSDAVTAFWCLHLLLLRCCSCSAAQANGAESIHQVLKSVPARLQHQAAQAGPLQQAASVASATSTISKGTHAARHLPIKLLPARLITRRLNAFKALAAGTEETGMAPYPQNTVDVRRFLQDALRGSDTPYTVPTWVVVVIGPSSAAAANITKQQAAEQIGHLNRAYVTGLPEADNTITESGTLTNRRLAGPHAPAVQPTRQTQTSSSSHKRLKQLSGNSEQLWEFRFMGVRYATSSSPMCVGSKTAQQIKAEWHPKLISEGKTVADRTLIIYVSDITNDACKGAVKIYSKMFGYGNTPYDLVNWKQYSLAYQDGVVIDPRYLYNPKWNTDSWGSLHGASRGVQLAHEVGHWMGLAHTFEGGCSSNTAKTDQVADTPAEAFPTQWGADMRDASSGCGYKDSCGNIPGTDITYNYMTYNNLACGRAFTSGQQARMLYLFRIVRLN